MQIIKNTIKFKKYLIKIHQLINQMQQNIKTTFTWLLANFGNIFAILPIFPIPCLDDIHF